MMSRTTAILIVLICVRLWSAEPAPRQPLVGVLHAPAYIVLDDTTELWCDVVCTGDTPVRYWADPTTLRYVLPEWPLEVEAKRADATGEPVRFTVYKEVQPGVSLQAKVEGGPTGIPRADWDPVILFPEEGYVRKLVLRPGWAKTNAEIPESGLLRFGRLPMAGNYVLSDGAVKTGERLVFEERRRFVHLAPTGIPQRGKDGEAGAKEPAVPWLAYGPAPGTAEVGFTVEVGKNLPTGVDGPGAPFITVFAHIASKNDDDNVEFTYIIGNPYDREPEGDPAPYKYHELWIDQDSLRPAGLQVIEKHKDGGTTIQDDPDDIARRQEQDREELPLRPPARLIYGEYLSFRSSAMSLSLFERNDVVSYTLVIPARWSWEEPKEGQQLPQRDIRITIVLPVRQ